jgi:AraC family transcriptional regulator of adaptative response/methylated-DNA-[protein]-cysteine methyltransferase
MSDYEQLAEDYARVEQAIIFLERNARRQPSLGEIAAAAGLSEFHFQRLFGRWVGISPKRFLQFLTKEHARRLLEQSRNVLDAAYEAGLSGPGRLHDLFVACEAVTPGDVQARGEGLAVHYGLHPSPFGRCLLAVTDRGICGLHFVRDDEQEAVNWLRLRWPRARLRQEPQRTGPYLSAVFPLAAAPVPVPLHLYVRGTNFQIQVWQALLRIPLGGAVSYEGLARAVGLPQGARAVGNAVGDNPIPFLIPCHRVIRKLGEFGNYGEGPARKKAILGWEAALLHRDELEEQ